MPKRNIVHVEIPTRNVDESGKFYAELFGWKITTDTQMDYTMWEAEEMPGGGFSPLGEQVKVGELMIYIDSDDIEADLERVTPLGGEVIQPKTEIPNTGWLGVSRTHPEIRSRSIQGRTRNITSKQRPSGGEIHPILFLWELELEGGDEVERQKQRALWID